MHRHRVHVTCFGATESTTHRLIGHKPMTVSQYVNVGGAPRCHISSDHQHLSLSQEFLKCKH